MKSLFKLILLCSNNFENINNPKPKPNNPPVKILFGMLFGLFLVGHSGWKLVTGHHR